MTIRQIQLIRAEVNLYLIDDAQNLDDRAIEVPKAIARYDNALRIAFLDKPEDCPVRSNFIAALVRKYRKDGDNGRND